MFNLGLAPGMTPGLLQQTTTYRPPESVKFSNAFPDQSQKSHSNKSKIVPTVTQQLNQEGKVQYNDLEMAAEEPLTQAQIAEKNKEARRARNKKLNGQLVPGTTPKPKK